MGVGVGTASTKAKRLFDDGAPRMSQLKVLVDHAVRRHSLCRLPPPIQTRDTLTLERLLRSDSDLDSGVATMCAVATVKVRVRSEQALEL